MQKKLDVSFELNLAFGVHTPSGHWHVQHLCPHRSTSLFVPGYNLFLCCGCHRIKKMTSIVVSTIKTVFGCVFWGVFFCFHPPEHFVGVAWDGSLLVGGSVALRLEQRVGPAVHHHGGRGHGDDGHAVAHAGLQAVVPLIIRDRQQTWEGEEGEAAGSDLERRQKIARYFGKTEIIIIIVTIISVFFPQCPLEVLQKAFVPETAVKKECQRKKR